MPVFPLKTPPNGEGFFSLSETEVRHLHRSLRRKSGDSFEVLLPDGRRAQAVLIHEKKGWSGKIESISQEPSARTLPLWLAIGMIRWPRLEWLVEKSCELGVDRISPLFFQFGKFSPEKGISSQKMTRLTKIAEETLKQSERARPPQIDPPQTLDVWMSQTRGIQMNKFLLDETLREPRLNSDLFQEAQPFVFLIGPEGGFAPEERKNALSLGFQPVSLGIKKLRTETAALYATCLLDSFLKI